MLAGREGLRGRDGERHARCPFFRRSRHWGALTASGASARMKSSATPFPAGRPETEAQGTSGDARDRDRQKRSQGDRHVVVSPGSSVSRVREDGREARGGFPGRSPPCSAAAAGALAWRGLPARGGSSSFPGASRGSPFCLTTASRSARPAGSTFSPLSPDGTYRYRLHQRTNRGRQGAAVLRSLGPSEAHPLPGSEDAVEAHFLVAGLEVDAAFGARGELVASWISREGGPRSARRRRAAGRRHVEPGQGRSSHAPVELGREVIRAARRQPKPLKQIGRNQLPAGRTPLSAGERRLKTTHQVYPSDPSTVEKRRC